MTIEAKIIADSLNGPLKTRFTTWQLRYPRFIHAEIMTHRALGRNASSSRAIPVEKQLQRIETDLALPVEWGSNKPGMQAGEPITPEQEARARIIWQNAADYAVHFSREMDQCNVHKQITNRIAEPFSHISVIISGTEWANFFALRAHPMAQPEFRVLAELMAKQYQENIPNFLNPGEWHLPYITFDDEVGGHDLLTLLKCSVARCARVSYMNHDGTTPSVESDLKLYDRLAGGKPLHASPTEHQATPFYRRDDLRYPTPMPFDEPTSPWGYPFDSKWKDERPWSANLCGFFQYRQALAGQNETEFPFPRPSHQ